MVVMGVTLFEAFLHYFYLSADMFNEMQNMKG